MGTIFASGGRKGVEIFKYLYNLPTIIVLSYNFVRGRCLTKPGSYVLIRENVSSQTSDMGKETVSVLAH